MKYFKTLAKNIKKEVVWTKEAAVPDNIQSLTVKDKEGKEYTIDAEEITPSDKKNYWPIFTAGAGLFSDGYINGSISTANVCLSKIYGTQYTASSAYQNVTSIVFIGTICGMVGFGYISDYVSRKTGMLISSGGLILFSILAAGSWGVGTEPQIGGNAGGLFAALTAYRFFLGIFVGAEYPTGSAACAEASALLPARRRNRYFGWFTNTMINCGSIIANFVPFVLLYITGTKHLQPVWRITMGFGAICPLSLFVMRYFFNEGTQFKKLNFKSVKVPWLLTLKFYWFRLLVVSLIWWIFDFSAYAFGIYSSTILNHIIKDGDLHKTFGWTIVINLFNIPGSVIGAYVADYIGPRLALSFGLLLQAMVGYIMAGLYPHLIQNVGAFVVVYGIFIALGSGFPGNNTLLLAAKTSATPVRGVYFGIAAALGKVGAFCGTYAFPTFQKHYTGNKGYQVPFWLASSLAILAAVIGFFFLPACDQDAMQREDFIFMEYLSNNGFDITNLGDKDFKEGTVDNTSDESFIETEIEFVDDKKSRA